MMLCNSRLLSIIGGGIVLVLDLLLWSLNSGYGQAYGLSGSDSVLGGSWATVDQVVAVIGDEPLFLSEIQTAVQQFRVSGSSFLYSRDSLFCLVLEQAILQKLLYQAALRDSLTVSEIELDAELNRRLQAFLGIFGSEEALEEFYGKPMEAIRQELRRLLREQMLANQKKEQLLANISITPIEVQEFYDRLVGSGDSVPFVEARYTLGIIWRYVEPFSWQWDLAFQEAQDLLKRLEGGASFSVLATLYSDDPETQRAGGRLGWRTWHELPDYLKGPVSLADSGSILGPFRTEEGWEIYLLEGKQADRYLLRKILLRPALTRQNYERTYRLLDSVRRAILSGALRFEDAARQYSQHGDTRYAGGYFMDFEQMRPEVPVSALPAFLLPVLDTLKEGEVSGIVLYPDEWKPAYWFVYLVKVVPAHRLSLDLDYDQVAQMALEYKKQQFLKEWMRRERQKTFIHIDASLRHCFPDFF